MPSAVTLLIATLALVGCVATAWPQQPQNPVIGIFTTPLSDSGPPPPGITANAAVESYFVNWLQASGIRVIPFPWNATKARAEYLAKRVNGVLFPGGGLVGADLAYYVSKVQFLLNLTKKWNAAGDKFFLWGTCQGFQVLSAAAANNVSVIEGVYHGMYPLMMPLNFTLYQRTSKLFGSRTTPAEVLTALSTKPTTLNWHHEIITPASFRENPTLGAYFKPLSTNNVPVGGKQFVSSMESYTDNVFATQFHPERPPYEFSNDIISHTDATLSVSHYTAKFIAERLKLNNHSFDTPQQAESYNVLQYPIQNFGWGSQNYWVMDQNE